MAERETIEEVFSNLTTAIYRLKASSNIRFQNVYINSIKLGRITSKIWGCQLNDALSYTILALKDIGEIKSINNKLILTEPEFDENEVPVYAVDDDGQPLFDEDGNEYLRPTRKQEYRFEMNLKRGNEEKLNEIESELTRLRDEIITRSSNLTGGNILQSDSSSTTELLSFKYKHFDDSQDNITELKKALINHKLIDPQTSLPDFRKVFAGVEIDTPVKWVGTQTEFAYFIKLLTHKLKKVEAPLQMRWKIAGHCFVQSNGTPFEWEKLRLQKEPANAKELEALAKIL